MNKLLLLIFMVISFNWSFLLILPVFLLNQWLVRWVAFNYAPLNWAFCNGQILPINQNEALFSLLGTIYGGDGRTTFALPDMRTALPMHAGTIANRQVKIGQKSKVSDKFKPSNQGVPTLALNCIIALQGIYPSRNWMARLDFIPWGEGQPGSIDLFVC